MVEKTTFLFPTKIRFGAGVIHELKSHLNEQKIHHPLIVTDSICSQLPFFQSIIQSLNCTSTVFDQIHKNPLKSDIDLGKVAFNQNDCDAVIGIGGGASLDVARAIALIIHHPGDLFDYEECKGGEAKITKPIPYFITIPTTSGTGSEVGRSSVISDNVTKEKKILFSPRLMAKIVFADPELTLDLPPKITAATGMDALTHNIEAFLAKGYNPMCDGIALEGIRIIFQNLPNAVEKGDIESRSSMMMAALMGAVAFQKGLGVVHSSTHPLSTLYDIHHGLANAIMLPYGIEFNIPQCPDKLQQLADAIWSHDFLRSTKELAENLNLPCHLSDIGVKEKDITKLSELAFEDPCHTLNPRPVTKQDFLTLYQKAL